VFLTRERRRMEIFSTEPGVQFYSGNFLDGTIKGKKNVIYQNTRFLPRNPALPRLGHHPQFPNTILNRARSISRPPSSVLHLDQVDLD